MDHFLGTPAAHADPSAPTASGVRKSPDLTERIAPGGMPPSARRLACRPQISAGQVAQPGRFTGEFPRAAPSLSRSTWRDKIARQTAFRICRGPVLHRRTSSLKPLARPPGKRLGCQWNLSQGVSFFPGRSKISIHRINPTVSLFSSKPFANGEFFSDYPGKLLPFFFRCRGRDVQLDSGFSRVNFGISRLTLFLPRMAKLEKRKVERLEAGYSDSSKQGRRSRAVPGERRERVRKPAGGAGKGRGEPILRPTGWSGGE